jgi:enoyl-CoA hydratase/carnithine racemase
MSLADASIQCSLVEGIFFIEISRPEKKNALTTAMYGAMAEALGRAAGDPAAKLVVFRGAKGVFTAGNDLGDFLANPPRDASAPVFRFIDALAFFEKPVVAIVEGLAVGIGTTLLLHCDLVFAAEDTRFILPFVNLGLSPEAGSSYLLPLRAGHARAAEMLLLGQPFSAKQASEAGLVNQVVGEGKVSEVAIAKCRALAAQPAASLRATKRLMKERYASTLREVLARETDVFISRVSSPEAKEAFSAFAEKRKPDFSRFA